MSTWLVHTNMHSLGLDHRASAKGCELTDTAVLSLAVLLLVRFPFVCSVCTCSIDLQE